MIRILLLPLFIIAFQANAQNWYKVEPESYDFERVELKEKIIDTTRCINTFRDSTGEIFRQDTSFRTRQIQLDSLQFEFYDYESSGFGTLTNFSVRNENGDELFSVENMVSLTPNVDYYFLQSTSSSEIGLLIFESKTGVEHVFFHTGVILFYKGKIVDLGNFSFVPLDSDGQTRLSYTDVMELSYLPFNDKIEMKLLAPMFKFSPYYSDNIGLEGVTRVDCLIIEMEDIYGNILGWKMLCEQKIR